VITAGTSCHNGSPEDGKVCQLQAKNPLISTVQISQATSKFDNDLSECQGGNLAEASAKTFGIAVVGSAVGAFHGLS